MLTVVKCFIKPMGFSHRWWRSASLLCPQIERRLSFQWEQYAGGVKDKEVNRSGV